MFSRFIYILSRMLLTSLLKEIDYFRDNPVKFESFVNYLLLLFLDIFSFIIIFQQIFNSSLRFLF